MEINHNSFTHKFHAQETREWAARQRELEAAQRILKAETDVGSEALANTVEAKPTETQESPQDLAA